MLMVVERSIRNLGIKFLTGIAHINLDCGSSNVHCARIYNMQVASFTGNLDDVKELLQQIIVN